MGSGQPSGLSDRSLRNGHADRLKCAVNGRILAAMPGPARQLSRSAPLIACLLACGCNWKGEVATPPSGPGPEPDAEAVWQMIPKSLRVYPSSRIVLREDHNYIEARVEVLDEMGDSTKAVGRFRIYLSEPGADGADSIGQRLYTWPIAMYTLCDQKRYYDSVLRGYLFRLQVERMPPNLDRAVLEVALDAHRGPRLSGKAVVAVSTPSTEQ